MQRCRNHKMRNVTGHLPKELHDQASVVLRAAWKLGAKDGKVRIEQFAFWVEKQHPDAAGSLREGLDELFTVSGIGLTPALRRCLSTTNVIDNAHSGMRRRTGRVTRWRETGRWPCAGRPPPRSWTPIRATAGSWATRTSRCSRRTWTSSALPRLTEGGCRVARLDREPPQPPTTFGTAPGQRSVHRVFRPENVSPQSD